MRLSPSHAITLQKGIQAGTDLIMALLITIFLTLQDSIRPSYRHLTNSLMEILFAKA